MRGAYRRRSWAPGSELAFELCRLDVNACRLGIDAARLPAAAEL
jgi:hypothetical protein